MLSVGFLVTIGCVVGGGWARFGGGLFCGWLFRFLIFRGGTRAGVFGSK